MAPLLVHHVRQGVVAGDVGGADVDSHHQVEALRRSLEDGLRPDGAGVVDQNVEAAELGDGALDQVANGVLIADIGGDGEGAPARGADGVRGFVDAAGQSFGGLLGLGCHYDIRAFLREADCERFADAATGAGDHGDAAGQVGMKIGIGFGHTLTLPV